MNIKTIVGSIVASLLLCSNAQGLTQAQVKQGCVDEGRSVSCSNQMQRVEAAPMQRVEAAPMQRVEAAPMQRVEAAPIRRVEAAPIRRVEAAPIRRVEPAPMNRYRSSAQAPKSNIDAEARRRGKVIDPKGQGLNQAQIDAMERQRQLMWNATGGGMVYR